MCEVKEILRLTPLAQDDDEHSRHNSHNHISWTVFLNRENFISFPDKSKNADFPALSPNPSMPNALKNFGRKEGEKNSQKNP